MTGLNIEFDEVRSRILGRNHIPLIGEVFAEVRREERRRQVMLGKKVIIVPPPVEGSALVVPQNRKPLPNLQGGDKNHLVCDYCGQNRHTRQNCFKLHGRPNNRKAGRFGDRPTSTTNEDQNSGKMIGTAREMNGLYYFDETPLGNAMVFGLNIGKNRCVDKEDNFGETLPTQDDIVTTNHPDTKIVEPIMLNLELSDNIMSETGGEKLIEDHNPQVMFEKGFTKVLQIQLSLL
ncbi:hypothetical protein KIW84_011656 [Lathyrus oleraceus]|uniref:Uncharacterized protein n=1 Tax=Pisum sativum TaxID=3888 RepID=A0A9D5BFH8_PEA|nr:hypothetical protein KIW84_011656 [Pisum sativum]